MINMSKQIPAFCCDISVYEEVFLSDIISKEVYNVKENHE